MATKRSSRKAGGFRVPARTARLVFKDELYQGAEVVVNLGVPLGVSMDMSDRDETDPRGIYSTFVEYGIESWNLEDGDGKRLPVTVEGLEKLPTDFVLVMLDEWVKQIGSVPVPLWAQSEGGSTSPAESTPTETA